MPKEPAEHRTGKYGFFVGYEDLARIFSQHEDEFKKYSRAALERDVSALYFLGIKSRETTEYIVGPESVFYPYLRDEGRKEVYVIS